MSAGQHWLDGNRFRCHECFQAGEGQGSVFRSHPFRWCGRHHFRGCASMIFGLSFILSFHRKLKPSITDKHSPINLINFIINHLHSIKSKVAANFVFVAVLILASSAQAALVVSTTNQFGAAPFTPAWTPAGNSLIAGLVPTTALGNFSEEIAGRNVNSLTAGGSLTITSVGSPTTCSTNYVTCGNGNSAGSTIIYTLPAVTNGYHLTNITVYSGWQDNGRDAQAYTVSYATVVNPAVFTVLTAVNYNPSVPAGSPTANRVILADSAGGGGARTPPPPRGC